MKNYENLGTHEWACRMGYKQIYYKYENLGIPQRETEKEHLKYNEHSEKTTQNQPFIYH
jgi:hypothetical protein